MFTDPAKRDRVQTVLVVVLAVGLPVGLVGVWGYMLAQGENRLSFEYSAILEPNGSGEARVSLPIPENRALLAGLRISPAPVTFGFNHSGAEPSLDVVIRGRTFVNATFEGTRYGGATAMADLTRTGEILACGPNCTAELAVHVVVGTLTAVQVTLLVRWATSCDFIRWSMEAFAAPGASVYPGGWDHAVC